jgi:glycerol-3-phosphate dehydrogenase
VRHYCNNEWAIGLDDVMIRRTSWFHNIQQDASVAGQVARWMAETLKWDESMLSNQLDRYDQMRQYHQQLVTCASELGQKTI